MTLEERVESFQECVRLMQGALGSIVKAGTSDHSALGEVIKRVDALEGQVKDLDVMVLSIKGMLEETLEILKA